MLATATAAGEEAAVEGVLDALKKAIEEGVAKDAAALARSALDAGAAPGTILRDVMVPAMDEVGRRYERGEYFLPEMLVSARAMKEALAILRPRLVATDVRPVATVVAGTVKGDLHDIGKNLVCMMLEGAGFEVRDLGADVAPEKFVEAVRGGGVRLVVLSALLTTTLPSMKVTIEQLKAAGLRDQVGVMVGGAPVNHELAAEIGADGYAEDAAGAVALARRLVGQATP
jgi:5-methyltetrahydrofolate--homocysteine methyltransferase